MVKKLFLTLFLFSGISYAVEIQNLAQAIDISGKQRMYTQRLLKDYAMVGMQNKFGNPKEDLQKTIQNFEDHLNSLEKFTNDGAIKANIAKAKQEWQKVKQKLTAPPAKENAVTLQKELDNLLQISDTITKQFAAKSATQAGEIINISGRQRMLSQRMASLYMLKVWGIEDPQFKQKLQDAMQLFKTSLDKLIAYDKNTPQINTLLKKAKRSFMFFDIMGKSNSKFIPSLIYKKSNDILKDMNTATKLYTKLETK